MSAETKTRLISRKQVKCYALAAASHRAHKFTRVSADFFVKVEGHVKQFIRDYVGRLPSKGKTIV
jgi:hypothetical protein